jgi:hypothetical protein
MAVDVLPAAIFSQEQAGDEGLDTGCGLETAQNGRRGRVPGSEDPARRLPEFAAFVGLQEYLIVFNENAVNGRTDTNWTTGYVHDFAVIVKAEHS